MSCLKVFRNLPLTGLAVAAAAACLACCVMCLRAARMLSEDEEQPAVESAAPVNGLLERVYVL